MKKFFFGVFLTLLCLSIVRYFFTDDNGGVSIVTVLRSLTEFGDRTLQNVFNWPELFYAFRQVDFSESFIFVLEDVIVVIGQLLYLPIEILFRCVYIIIDVWNLIAGLVGMPVIPEFRIPNPFI